MTGPLTKQEGLKKQRLNLFNAPWIFWSRENFCLVCAPTTSRDKKEYPSSGMECKIAEARCRYLLCNHFLIALILKLVAISQNLGKLGQFTYYVIVVTQYHRYSIRTFADSLSPATLSSLHPYHHKMSQRNNALRPNVFFDVANSWVNEFPSKTVIYPQRGLVIFIL